MATAARTPEASARPQFFVSQKRNEISELKALFRALPAESINKPESTEKRREILKRLIAYMSMGIDVSSLFSDVVLASATSDIAQKRLVSIYLNNYADTNPDTAILVINAYQKDLLNADPRIRGLALKALSSLGVDSVEEYASEAVTRGLSDTSSYTRTLAVIGVNKLVYKSSSAAGLVERLEQFVHPIANSNQQPVDLQVLIATLLVLMDVRGEAYTIEKTTIVHLFNRLPTASRFQKTVILHILKTYVPESDDELVGLLQTTEVYLSSVTPSVVSSTMICMLSLIRQRYKNKERGAENWKTSPLALSVIKRVTPSLITLSTSYPILKLIYQLCTFEPVYCDIFREQWVWLVPKYGDNEFVKILKYKILSLFDEPMILDSVAAVVVIPVEAPAVLESIVDLFRTAFFRGCVHTSKAFESTDTGQVDEDDNCELVLQMLLKWYVLQIPSVCSALLPLLSDIFLTHNTLRPYCHSLFSSIHQYIGELDARGCEALLNICAIEPLNMDVRSICAFLFEKIKLYPDVLQGTRLLGPMLQTLMKVLLTFPSAIKDLLYDILEYINAHMGDLPIEVTERYLMMSRLVGRDSDVLRRVYGRGLEPKKLYYQSFVSAVPSTRFEDLDSLCNPSATLPFGPAYAGKTVEEPEIIAEEHLPTRQYPEQPAKDVSSGSLAAKDVSGAPLAAKDVGPLAAAESLLDQSFLTEVPIASHDSKVAEELLL